MCNRVCASQNWVKHLILVIVLLFHVFSWKNIYYLQSLINNTRIKIHSVLHNVYTNFRRLNNRTRTSLEKETNCTR